jgi:hypothetical protein
MVGFNTTIVPAASGTILINIDGQATVASGSVGGTVSICVGTGTPPANGATLPSGATVVSNQLCDASKTPAEFVVSGLALNLTRGTTYWLGAMQTAPSGGIMFNLTGVTLVAAELG